MDGASTTRKLWGTQQPPSCCVAYTTTTALGQCCVATTLGQPCAVDALDQPCIAAGLGRPSAVTASGGHWTAWQRPTSHASGGAASVSSPHFPGSSGFPCLAATPALAPPGLADAACTKRICF